MEKIIRVRLNKEDKGFSLSFEKQTPKQNAEGPFVSPNTQYVTENFGEDQVDQAIKRFKELIGIKTEE